MVIARQKRGALYAVRSKFSSHYAERHRQRPSVTQDQFIKIGKDVRVEGDTLVIKGIDNTFGSINRVSLARVTVTVTDGGYLLLADVDYRPSAFFWILFILGLFTWVVWLVPIAFYLIQKSSVRVAIEKVFERVKNEFDQIITSEKPFSVATEILALNDLKNAGVITQQEFDSKKTKLLS